VRLLIIHGANLNLLGEREISVYGKTSLNDINNILIKIAKVNKIRLKIYQYNSEEKIINCLHKYRKKVNGIIINPAAYTHYSYAIRDAIAAIKIPAIEVHLSNIKEREDFRKISVIADVCLTQFMGEGINSYIKAIDYFNRLFF